jgi:large subunit ribosomal protein L10
MKKIGLLFKEIAGNRIKTKLKESNSTLIIKYAGLSSPDLSGLRQTLKNANAHLFVVKNTVGRRTFKNSRLESLVKLIEGPCGLVFVKGELVDVCRLLYNFAKEHESLKLEGGFLKERILDKKDIDTLARLPSKEILKAQVVMTLQSPISRLVRVLNQTLTKLVWCLEQIKNKKGS